MAASPGRRGLAALAALGLLPRALRGQPGGVTLLVGATPGSAADIWARSFAPFLERHWARAPIAIVNRPGEGGLAAARNLAAGQPDGRVLAAIGTPLLLARAVEAQAEGVLGRLSFLAAVAEEPVVLVGLAGTVDDLEALRALGAGAILGTPAAGSAPHLAAAALGRAVPLTHLTFPNPAAARQAVLSGNIACALVALPDVIGALRDGRLAGIGLAQEQRSPLLPDTPTLVEQGIDLDMSAHRGFAVPLGLDPAIRASLLSSLRAAVDDPEFAAQAEVQGYIPRFIGQETWDLQLRRLLAALADRWTRDPWTGRRD